VEERAISLRPVAFICNGWLLAITDDYQMHALEQLMMYVECNPVKSRAIYKLIFHFLVIEARTNLNEFS
jgi:hypothetical protein